MQLFHHIPIRCFSGSSVIFVGKLAIAPLGGSVGVFATNAGHEVRLAQGDGSALKWSGKIIC